MMELKWSSKALSDLPSSTTFLHRQTRKLPHAPFNRLYMPLSDCWIIRASARGCKNSSRFEVRRILVGKYEMRYQNRATTTYVLRLWHT